MAAGGNSLLNRPEAQSAFPALHLNNDLLIRTRED
jgi:hypothetical protein